MLRKVLMPVILVIAVSLALSAPSLGALSGNAWRVRGSRQPARLQQAQVRQAQVQQARIQQNRQLRQIQRPLRLVESASEVVPVKTRFNLGDNFGSRRRVQLSVTEPGRILMRAEWTGSAGRLALILNGPGQVGAYQRVDGESPLQLEFNVTPALVEQGDQWTVSIVNFGGGYARGVLAGEQPAHTEQVDLTSAETLRALRINESYQIVGAPGGGGGQQGGGAPAGSGEPVRTVLEDGTIEIRYPDGTIQRFPPGGCGFEVIYPDGRVSQVQCVMMEVQGTDLPELPSDLTEEELNGWLTGVADRLINTITIVVDNEQALANYMALEEGKSLLERIDLRSEAIKHLMAPPPQLPQ